MVNEIKIQLILWFDYGCGSPSLRWMQTIRHITDTNAMRSARLLLRRNVIWEDWIQHDTVHGATDKYSVFILSLGDHQFKARWFLGHCEKSGLPPPPLYATGNLLVFTRMGQMTNVLISTLEIIYNCAKASRIFFYAPTNSNITLSSVFQFSIILAVTFVVFFADFFAFFSPFSSSTSSSWSEPTTCNHRALFSLNELLLLPKWRQKD